MSIFYYEPFYDFERFLDEATNTRTKNEGPVHGHRRAIESGNQSGLPTLKPKMDLHEDTKDNIVTVTFELPGLKKEDVDIQVNHNRLTISGESKLSSGKEENGYVARERSYGKFARTLQLPQGVEEKQIKASLDNGVLTVVFPKSAAPKDQTPKKIKIN